MEYVPFDQTIYLNFHSNKVFAPYAAPVDVLRRWFNYVFHLCSSINEIFARYALI